MNAEDLNILLQSILITVGIITPTGVAYVTYQKLFKLTGRHRGPRKLRGHMF